MRFVVDPHPPGKWEVRDVVDDVREHVFVKKKYAQLYADALNARVPEEDPTQHLHKFDGMVIDMKDQQGIRYKAYICKVCERSKSHAIHDFE